MSCESPVRGELASGNIYIREYDLKPGETIRGHLHHFDHTSFTMVPVRVRRTWADGREEVKDFAPGEYFLVEKDCWHEITSLAIEPGPHDKFFCIYSHRDPQGEVVQTYDGWHLAHAAVKGSQRA